MTDNTQNSVAGSAHEKLRQTKSLQEILEVALSFEKMARDFYADLATRVSKPMRGLVEELASEEQGHYNMFKDLMNRDDVHAHFSEKFPLPPSDHKFSDFVHLPDLGESPDDQDVLRYALDREQAAMEQYASLAEEVPPGPIADLFRFLAQEELEHKKELEKKYLEVVYSGGV